MRSVAAAALPLLLAGPAWADTSVQVCYNYGCAVEAQVVLAEARFAELGRLLATARTPEAERDLLALAVGRLYAWAGEQTPVWRDRGGNYNDDDSQSGRMDCIDHATTTTRFLDALAARGWLRFHRVLPPQRRTRFLIGQHFSAAIEELGPVRDPEHPAPERYVVDSWFRDNGKPAVIMPLEQWQEGADPDVD
ncbi:MAG TPA: hypothetical protein VF801_09565 [Rhodocyclaceae bacterium]